MKVSCHSNHCGTNQEIGSCKLLFVKSIESIREEDASENSASEPSKWLLLSQIDGRLNRDDGILPLNELDCKSIRAKFTLPNEWKELDL